MTEVQCPNCKAGHDGSMDANGWATCKSCVHLWNLKELIKSSQTQKEQVAAPATERKVKTECGVESPKAHTREMSGYFPDETVPKHTAALTKKESDSLLSNQKIHQPFDVGTLSKQKTEFSLPANSTMINVEEESRENKIQKGESDKEVESAIASTDKNEHHDNNEGLRAKTGFPRMETRIKKVSENAVHCPVCGGTVSVTGDDVEETACPHCDTTFNVKSGEYHITGGADGEGDRGSAGESASLSYTGKVIGGCKIGQKLGEGGMGSVYMAKQLSLDRDVAIKLLPPELTAQANFMKRFQQEARSLARINHNNIIGIFEFGEDADTGLNYMMMEYVDGEDLAEVLRKRHHLTEIEALDIVNQAALGLEQAALKGIIHRDIKPDNLMMTESGTCKVSDFGLAKNVASNATMTNASIRVGTPAFMSPEQCDGLSLDFRSDIYSLGVTLFVMLTGHLPFNGESPFAIMLKHKSEPAPAVTDSMAHVTVAVDQLVQKMMEKEPEKRFSSWRRLREELDVVIESISGKTKAFTRDDRAANEFIPRADLPTERTDLNVDLNTGADPADDVSAMMSSLGNLERMDGDHPPLRTQSAELEIGSGAPVDVDDVFADSADPLADMLADINQDADIVGAAASVTGTDNNKAQSIDREPAAIPDLSVQDVGAVSQQRAAVLSDPAMPDLPVTPAVPDPPMITASASGPQVAVGNVSASGPQQVPARISGPQRSQRAASSSGLSSQSTRESTRHESAIRRGKSAEKIRERMDHVKTDMHRRTTAMFNRGDVFNTAGKYKKAVREWEKAAQATTDVEIRETCYNKIRIAKLALAQRRKRRALLSAVVVVPLLTLAVYFSTPVAHDFYLQYEMEQIENTNLHEARKEKRWSQLADYEQPFAWYSAVFFGETYELLHAAKLRQKLQAYGIVSEQNGQQASQKKRDAENDEANNKKRTEKSVKRLQAMVLQREISWYAVFQVAQAVQATQSATPDIQDAEHVQIVQEIAAKAQSHIAKIEQDLDAIQEKIKQGKYDEAESIGVHLQQREDRGGEAVRNVPCQVVLKIVDESGFTVQGAELSINALRVRGAYRAYSMFRDAVHIEVQHGDFQTYVGEIPVGATTFTAVLRASEQWSNSCVNAEGPWTTLVAGTADYFLVNSAERMVAYSMADGHVFASIKRSDVNKANGLGHVRWENSAQVIRDNIYMGSGDGLLLELELDRMHKKFNINKVLYSGNYSVLSFVEYDLVFRSGSTKALVVRRNESAEIRGLINGREDWKYSGVSAKTNPQLFYKNERLYALGDTKFYVFDEGGQKKEHVPLSEQRTGPAQWLGNDTLAYPYAEGVAVIKFSDDGYRMHRGLAFAAAPIGGLVGDGQYIFVTSNDATLRSLSLSDGTLFAEWSHTLDAERQFAFAAQYAQGLVCVVDDAGGIYVYHANTGKLISKIQHTHALLTAPLLAFDRIIFVDQAKNIISYRIPTVR